MLPTLLLTTSLLLGAQWSSEWVPDPGHQPGRVTALAYGSMGATWIAYDRASGELALLRRENGWRVETAAQGPLEAFALAVTSPGAPVLAVAQGGEVFVLRRTGPATFVPSTVLSRTAMPRAAVALAASGPDLFLAFDDDVGGGVTAPRLLRSADGGATWTDEPRGEQGGARGRLVAMSLVPDGRPLLALGTRDAGTGWVVPYDVQRRLWGAAERVLPQGSELRGFALMGKGRACGESPDGVWCLPEEGSEPEPPKWISGPSPHRALFSSREDLMVLSGGPGLHIRRAGPEARDGVNLSAGETEVTFRGFSGVGTESGFSGTYIRCHARGTCQVMIFWLSDFQTHDWPLQAAPELTADQARSLARGDSALNFMMDLPWPPADGPPRLRWPRLVPEPVAMVRPRGLHGESRVRLGGCEEFMARVRAQGEPVTIGSPDFPVRWEPGRWSAGGRTLYDVADGECARTVRAGGQRWDYVNEQVRLLSLVGPILSYHRGNFGRYGGTWWTESEVAWVSLDVRTGEPASLEAFIERGSLLRALKEDAVVRKRFRGREEALEAATTPGPLLAALGPGGAVGFAFHHFDMKANRVDVRVGYMRKVCSHCTVGIQERSLRVRPTAELRRALEQAAAGQGLFMTTPKAQRFPLALPENLLR
jgi:hypothetical protein